MLPVATSGCVIAPPTFAGLIGYAPAGCFADVRTTKPPSQSKPPTVETLQTSLALIASGLPTA